MVSYLEYEQEAIKQKIKAFYVAFKDDLADETKNSPLREITYESTRRPLRKDGIPLSGVEESKLIIELNKYIHKYKIDLDRDITLEEAVNSL